MGESDRDVDSVVDGLEGLGLASEVTVIVGDGERTFKCERGLLSRGCGYFKALFDFPGKGRGDDEVRLDVIGSDTFQDVLDIIGATGRTFSDVTDVLSFHGMNQNQIFTLRHFMGSVWFAIRHRSTLSQHGSLS